MYEGYILETNCIQVIIYTRIKKEKLMYKAIRYFTDLEDNSHSYNPGDIFPRENFQVSEKRIEDLLTGNNRRGIPVIEKVEAPIEIVADAKAEATTEPEQEEKSAKPKRGRKKKNAD